ncbi:glycosyltransferase [Balneolales bacterium ANBcel1]|nr:glycosyltransferase [Balneolales bacterium ANBcel1]
MTIRYSIIIPVYNRPGELSELLESLAAAPAEVMSRTEVIVVDDGSEERSGEVCRNSRDTPDIRYLYQDNRGPGGARNTGAGMARGEWLIFFDSDCIIPPGYMDAVEQGLSNGNVDVFGGPDRASDDFTPTQKAIDYAMTSFLTTGGIRGGRKQLDRYYPRSFNMGIRKSAFDAVDGFSSLRFGEDLDLSMRLIAAGYRTALLDRAWVYHKRRTDLKKFFKQVYNSGMARVVLNKRHPGTMKAVHWMPSLFVLYLAAAFLSLPVAGGWLWLPPALFCLLLFLDGWRKTRHLVSALLVPPAALFQLSGYGTGLLHALVIIHILGRTDARAFEKNFYR